MIRGSTRIAAVIGWPVEHSRSPQMLNAAFAAAGVDAVMVPIAVLPEEFPLAVAGLRAANALGASVTIPHKLAALALCNELSPEARAIGAVNCLHITPDALVGHNTDCDGFTDGLRAAGCPEPKHVVLLGAGGAARAVAYGLRAAATIDVIAREPDRVDWVRRKRATGPIAAADLGAALATSAWTPMQHSEHAERAVITVARWREDSLRAAFSRADLVVDCTSIALGDNEVTLIDELPLAALPPAAWVSTLVYHKPTLLLERARSRGHAVVDGRAMLIHQGARAFAIWTAKPAPIDAMRDALDRALHDQATA